MSLDQLYLARPLPSLSDYRSPVRGLYLCGSGSHPGLPLNRPCDDALKMRSFAFFEPGKCSFLIGGGVMGSPGWNAALAVMADLKHQ